MTSPTTDRRLGLVGNTAFKAPVTAIAVSNVTQYGEQTIDGVAVLESNTAGVPDRVLCVGQTDSTTNGIWDVSTSAWTRSHDADGRYDLAKGSNVLVTGGTTYSGTFWQITSANPITIGTSSMTWARSLSNSATMSFVQAGTGAVTRTAQEKMRETVSVDDFGAVGDGLTSDTVTVQAAIDAVSVRGGGDLLFPNGTYLLGAINLKAGVRLRGESKAAILKASIGAANAFITVNSVSDTGLEGLTVDMNLMPGSDSGGAVAVNHTTALGAAANNISIKGCRFQGGVIRPYYDNRCSIASRGVYICDNEFIGKSTITIGPVAPNARATQALRFLSATGCGNWHVLNNRSRYCGTFSQIRHLSVQAFDQFDSVVYSGNEITDVLDDSNISSSPYEFFCITGLTVTGNTIYSGGRGFNATYCKGASYTGNTAYDQAVYFLEMQTCDGVAIVGNSAFNCKTFVNDTSASVGSKNILIRANNISGGNDGESGYSNYQVAANIITMTNVAGHRRWVVSGNVFSGLKWVTSHIRIDGSDLDGYVCEDNTFYLTEATCLPQTVAYTKGSNVSIRNNAVYASHTFGDAIAPTGSVYALIVVVMAGAGFTNVLVEGNAVYWSGTDGRTVPNNTGVIGIGANAGAAALPGLVVRRNKVAGAFTNPFMFQCNSGDTIFEDNDQSAATGSNILNAAIIYRRTKRQVEGTAAPTTGTWLVGEICWNSTPTNLRNGPPGWICNLGGTPGTWVAMGPVQDAITTMTDADATLTPLTSRRQNTLRAALTADRTLTLSTTNAYNGLDFIVTRTSASTGAFTLSVGGLKFLAPGQWCRVGYTGSAWELLEYGALTDGLTVTSKSADYPLVLSDGGTAILHPSADVTARVFTIPANSSVAYRVGTSLTFVNQNAAGTITIAITTDTMRLAGAGTTGSRTLAANGIATAVKITSTEWIISGTGLT